ncbi:MAG: polyprenyl synthetase family protein [Truepera sp.]|nr:polyprenyl synthetase family protein [Truepera sp.]
MFDLIQPDLNDFETRLAQELRSSVAFIEAIGEDLAGAGGKRLRPALAFLAGRLLGANSEAAMQVALAVELLHSASLLHDDLIDNAATRRGHEAAFKRYGNVVSVMSGDYLLAKVLRLLARSESSAFTLLMADAATELCEGEVLQFQMAALENYSFENYFKVIEGKTAVLLSAALEGVAILAGADPVVRTALRRFGMSYGRAFQMQDDYLDLLGDEQALGKPIGGDLREGKATYAVLLLMLKHGLDEAGSIVRRHARQGGDVARMVALVREYGADQEAKARIRAEAEAASAALAAFPDSPAKAALTALAQREIARAA